MENSEILIRFVPLASQLKVNGLGEVELDFRAFPRDELACVDKDTKSASLLREAKVTHSDLTIRAKARNREDAWASDPVVARSRTDAVRKLKDKASRLRAACVHADAIFDHIGFCWGHAYVRKMPPIPGNKDVLDWKQLQAAVASCFADVKHLSGNTPQVASP